MSEAERAIEAAISVECKKHSLAQHQSGDWKLTLTVADMPTALMSTPPGTRYKAVFVEVDDTEQPVERPQDDTAGKITEARLKAKRHFEASCQDPIFVEWAQGRFRRIGLDWGRAEDTRENVKQLCGVESSNEFIEHPEKWTDLFQEFKYRDSVR